MSFFNNNNIRSHSRTLSVTTKKNITKFSCHIGYFNRKKTPTEAVMCRVSELEATGNSYSVHIESKQAALNPSVKAAASTTAFSLCTPLGRVRWPAIARSRPGDT